MGVMETVRGHAESGEALFTLVGNNPDSARLLAAMARALSAPEGGQ